MIIIFADKELKKCANNKKYAVRKMGALRARIYHQRLDDMAAAETFADLGSLPGRHHPLKEDRKDQWGCDLDQPYRLIYEPAETPVPKDPHGKQILEMIRGANIIQIINYH